MARATTLDMLRAPGLTVERSLELSGQWFNDLCLWLQSPIGALGNIGWPMVLIPEVVDSRFLLRDTALQVCQRLWWSGPIHRASFSASVRFVSVSVRRGTFDPGMPT